MIATLNVAVFGGPIHIGKYANQAHGNMSPLALILTLVFFILCIGIPVVLDLVMPRKKPDDDKNNRGHGRRDDFPKIGPQTGGGGLNPLLQQQLYEILNKQDTLV